LRANVLRIRCGVYLIFTVLNLRKNMVNDMNMDDTKAKRGLRRFNNKGYSRILRVCVIIGSCAFILYLYIVNITNNNDYKLLKKSLTVSGIRKVLDPARRKEAIEGRLDDKDNLVLCEVVLSSNIRRGWQYKLIDSPDDGFFPNDADGLVDKVSKRDIFSRRDMWSKRLYSRTPWTKMPFEPELYEIATERYKEATAKINSSPGSELGIKIGM